MTIHSTPLEKKHKYSLARKRLTDLCKPHAVFLKNLFISVKQKKYMKKYVMLPINDRPYDRIIFWLIEIAIIILFAYLMSATLHKDGAFHEHYEVLSYRGKIAAIYLACSLTFSNYCSYKLSCKKIIRKYSFKQSFVNRLFIAIISFMFSMMIIMPCLDYLVRHFL